MTTLHIHRQHNLGLERARAVASRWTSEARDNLSLICHVTSEAAQDTIAFSRSGVSGTLVVTGDTFELRAQLGFLMAAFAPAIEAEVTQNLDRLLQNA